MIRQIMDRTFLFLIPISLIFLVAFTGVFSADALVKGWSPAEGSSSEFLNEEDSQSKVINPSDGIQDATSDEYADFGSDQVFPFVAGLDSYE